MSNSGTKLKRRLFASSITIILTVVLFFNSTLAWYSDSEAIINTFTFGNIDMEVYKVTSSGDVNISGAENEIVTVTMQELSPQEFLFEPGVVFSMPPLYVKNTGDIPIKFRMKIQISQSDYDVNLWDVVDAYVLADDGNIDVPDTRTEFLAMKSQMLSLDSLPNKEWELDFDRTASGEGVQSQKFIIYLYMKESAGNDYNKPNLAVGGTFTVTFIGYQQNMDEDDVKALYDMSR